MAGATDSIVRNLSPTLQLRDPGWVDWLRSNTEAIGTVAGTLTTVAFLPQVLRSWRMRRQEDVQELSLAMLTLFGSGVGLWFVYGYLRISLPIILANGVTGVLILLIFVLKIWRASQRVRNRQATKPDRSFNEQFNSPT